MGQMTDQLKGIDLNKIKEAAQRKKDQQEESEKPQIYEVKDSDDKVKSDEDYGDEDGLDLGSDDGDLDLGAEDDDDLDLGLDDDDD